MSGCEKGPPRIGVCWAAASAAAKTRLVVRNQPHRLLAHRALVRVAGGLVVVGVRDQPSAHAEDSERVNLHVGVLRVGRQLALIDGDCVVR